MAGGLGCCGLGTDSCWRPRGFVRTLSSSRAFPRTLAVASGKGPVWAVWRAESRKAVRKPSRTSSRGAQPEEEACDGALALGAVGGLVWKRRRTPPSSAESWGGGTRKAAWT